MSKGSDFSTGFFCLFFWLVCFQLTLFCFLKVFIFIVVHDFVIVVSGSDDTVIVVVVDAVVVPVAGRLSDAVAREFGVLKEN